MAGETPDRSEQRSPGEAAAETAADPRLAVAKDRPVRVDQPTAVFSVAGAAQGRGEEASASAASSGADDEDAAEPAAAEGSADAVEPAAPAEPAEADAGKDARLRAAVAAWVAGEGPEGEDSEAAAPAPAPASDESGEPGESSESDASDEADEADESSEPEATEEPDSSGEAESSGEDEGEPAADTESPAEADEPGEAEAAASDDAVAKPEANDADDSNTESAPAGSASGAPEGKSEDEGDDARGEGKPAEGKPIDRATAVFKTLPKGAEEPAAGKSTDEPADEPTDKPVDQATAVFKTLAPKSPAESPAEPPAAAKPTVDQPTAMLKLPKPDAEKADEKAEGKAGNKAESKSEAEPKSESPAERTSKFVALKPLDEPAAPRAPKPPAPTPAEEAKPAEQPKAGPDHVGPERTRQQPLPPKPPLDLLAELTNTPPPAETAIRTTVRRVKIWTPLVLLLLVAFAIAQVVRPLPTPTLSLTAQEKVSFEGGKPQIPWPDQGQAALDVEGIGSFGTYGEQKPVPIASIAKVMTAYVILKGHPLKGEDRKGATIPVDKQAEEHYVSGKKDNESVVDVKEGEKLSEYEAIQALMLPSANNVAKLLARWDSDGDEKAFVQKMNDAAKKLGMKNTTYTDASGLDKTTVSTAEDLVKLGRAAMEIPVFKEIVGQPYYTPSNGRGDPNCQGGSKWCNFNSLVPTVAVGIKTGTTTAAGGNLLFASKKTVDGQEQIVIGAALAQFAKHTQANIDEVTANSRKLMEAAEAALTSKTIVKKGDVVGHVDDGLGGTTPVVATKDVKAVGWPGLTVQLKLDAAKGKTIPHSAKAGTTVGVLSVGDGKSGAVGAVQVPVALQQDMVEPGFGDKLTRIG
ncbi:D-alanyl-D-alanine carboxypeptidase [Streptomyces sp. NBC_01304]|uniref:D-alanyl-D-alanine carboxypeptidase n=1 Tax=Streptomyces sp. NBC_01304 TaxID=2903818 RepID=UPI002E0D4728|nr:D-alanyl-D-alanine carboxypeptidase [Streptomyces sp. NBC_01304]